MLALPLPTTGSGPTRHRSLPRYSVTRPVSGRQRVIAEERSRNTGIGRCFAGHEKGASNITEQEVQRGDPHTFCTRRGRSLGPELHRSRPPLPHVERSPRTTACHQSTGSISFHLGSGRSPWAILRLSRRCRWMEPLSSPECSRVASPLGRDRRAVRTGTGSPFFVSVSPSGRCD